MPRLHRRHFLQLAGSGLAAIGLNQLDFLHQGDRMHQALAQDTHRKLALLIGINGYPASIPSLSGCVNDVRLQYELLVHRYGFNPQDILIVTDERSAPGLDLAARNIIASATRQNIIDAFQDHLIAQAKPGDVVVFHYSGHGAYVNDPYPIDYANSPAYLNISGYEGFDGLDGTLVPTDALATGSDDTVNDIMGSTLFLLSKAVNTDNFTMVLDSCHAGGGTRGNLTYRAVNRESGRQRHPSAAELALKATLRERLGLTENQVQAQRQEGIAKGIAMGSARANQLAAEQGYEGLRAGVFTYLLTRYLWQTGTAESVQTMFVNLARITRATDRGIPQDPVYFVEPGKTLDQRPPYLLEAATPSADAVIRQMRIDQSIELWLGGMTPSSLKATNSIYEVIDTQGAAIARIQQDGGIYEGLKATAYAINDAGNRIAPPSLMQPGQLLREEIRGFGTDFKLRVGLHESLGEDLDTAGEMLAANSAISPVPIDGNATTDILIGRFDAMVQAAVQDLGIAERSDIATIADGTIGLLENNLTPVLDTFGASPYESIEGAISRLDPRFKLLLGRQVLESMVNATNTSLNVDLAIGTVERASISVVSSGAAQNRAAPEPPQVMVNERLTLQVTNRSNEALFVAVITTGPNGDLVVYHPSDWNAAEIDATLGAGERLMIPAPNAEFHLPVQGPAGFFKVMVLASRVQLRDSLRTLKRISERTIDDYFVVFDSSREASRSSEDSIFNVIGNFLQDFSRTGAVPQAIDASMDHNAVLTFATTIEVVE